MDQTFGLPDTHTTKLPFVGKRQSDVASFEIDSQNRPLVMSNNGGPARLNLAELDCDIVTITRLTDTGALDGSFARSGVFRFPKLARSVCAGAMRIDSRDRIVGTVRLISKDGRRQRIIFRLLPSGAFDPGFSGDGIKRVGPGNWNSPRGWGSNSQLEILEGDAIQVVTYKPVIGKRSKLRVRDEPTIERFSSTGARIREFGRNGSVVFGKLQSVEAIEVDDSGRIYLTGMGRSYKKFTRALTYRLTSSGKLDLSYGSSGRVKLGQMLTGRTFQFEGLATIGSGVTFFQLAQDKPVFDDTLDGRFGVVDPNGKMMGGTKSGWSDLVGWNFGIEGNKRIAVFRNSPLDGFNGFDFGFSDEQFNTVTMSPPLSNTTGGSLVDVRVSESGRDIWLVALVPGPGEFAGENYFGSVAIQRLKADW